MTLDPARRSEIEKWAAEWVHCRASNLARLATPDPIEMAYELACTFQTRTGDNDVAAIQKAIDAASSDPVAFDALCWAGAARLRAPDRNPEMTDDLRHFLASVLSGQLKRPGGKRRTHPERDAWVCSFIGDMVQAFGIDPTRNDESEHRDSACDFAASALKAAGLRPASYDRLKDDIWERRNDPADYPPRLWWQTSPNNSSP